jgi:cysteine synthase
VTILDFIGKTPLVRLKAIPTKESAEVWIKWEGANPTGSMKDRIALKMIESAEARGELRPNETVVEFTGGSTGVPYGVTGRSARTRACGPGWKVVFRWKLV